MVHRVYEPILSEVRLVGFIIPQIPFDDDHGRRLVFGSRLDAGRTLTLTALPLPGCQHEPPRDGHDDHNVVQTHPSHVDEVHRQNLIPNLKHTKANHQQLCLSTVNTNSRILAKTDIQLNHNSLKKTHPFNLVSELNESLVGENSFPL